MAAAARVLGGPVKITGASRTDAGVHALRQVASLSTSSAVPPAALRRALNALLPPSVRVLDACLASLNKSDRVRLVAVDTQVKPLSEGFFSPQSDEIRAAVTKLQQRVPLGATSLQPAKSASSSPISKPSPTPRSATPLSITPILPRKLCLVSSP